MTTGHDLVAQTVVLAGGEVIGRVRLQKVMYLLTRMGLNGPFRFAYHHYGPFSREVDDAISGAKAFSGLDESTGRRKADGVPFSVFKLKDPGAHETSMLGDLPADRAKAALARMLPVPSTVIEVAATIHWLRTEDKVPDWLGELKLRKGAKASAARVEAALGLLRELGFEAEAA